MGLLPTLEWAVGRRYRITLFDAEEGSITTQILTIAGTEQLQVPAGAFATFSADLTTTEAPVQIWVTQDSDHRLVQIASPGSPLTTVLVSQGRPVAH